MTEPWCEQQTTTNVGGASSASDLCYPTSVDDSNTVSQQQSIIPSQYEDTTSLVKNNNMVQNTGVSGNTDIFSNCFYSQATHDASGYAEQQNTCGAVKNSVYPSDGKLYRPQIDGRSLCNSVYDAYGYVDPATKYDNYTRWSENHALNATFAPRFWPKFSRRISYVTPRDSSIKVTLENKSLIEHFDKHCTEMIITKTGRRMFPSPQVSIQGLESATKYFVLFDIVPADDNRYKFHHFNWVIAGKSEPLPPSRLYIHPESPLTGTQWMKQQITFNKVKLTNNTCDQNGHIILNSMHRYQPRIHVVAACDIYSVQFQQFNTYAFPECQFIAVTAYQNSQVTQLKIEHNPFAKGFRKQEKEKRRDSEGSCDETKSKIEDMDQIKSVEKDLKRPYIGENKCYSGPDRKIGYYDLNLNRWNYNDANIMNQSGYSVDNNNSDIKSQHMIGYCPSQSKYDYRQPFYHNNNNNNNEFDKSGYPIYPLAKYNPDTPFTMCEPIRPFPYTPEFSTQEYRANGPAFI